MEKMLAIKGCIVTLALLLLSSPSIAFAKELSDLRSDLRWEGDIIDD